MYFLQLPDYSPTYGISTQKHGKFPFLSSLSGLFEPAVAFAYQSGFPFERIETGDQDVFYVSEPNLVKVFKNKVAEQNEILLENTRPITEEYTKELIQLFYKGYLSGFEGFNNEIGSAFLSLDLAHQKEMLEQFMDYCQRDLYFEGFAIPQLLHNLGYIQACLVRAFKEYQNLSCLTVKADLAQIPTTLPENTSAQAPINKGTKSVFLKIPLKYSIGDIITIWLVLLDVPKCKSLSLTPEFKTESDVAELLGSMFADISGEHSKLPDSPHRFYELPIDYQPILYLLMHATYKLNYTYTRLPLEEYSKCLKATFSVYDAIELNYMPGNFTKKQPVAIAAIKELGNSSHAKNALQILSKIPNYRITI
ncbi:MAG: hypothetical protein NVSMB24_18290 [Mucilaginibacter sp.]